MWKPYSDLTVYFTYGFIWKPYGKHTVFGWFRMESIRFPSVFHMVSIWFPDGKIQMVFGWLLNPSVNHMENHTFSICFPYGFRMVFGWFHMVLFFLCISDRFVLYHCVDSPIYQFRSNIKSWKKYLH